MTENKNTIMALANGLIDKSKELQKEILMEKLRSKTSQYKNLSETSKAVRMTLLDKRWAVDAADRMILQKCLDSLQHCIKVSSLQSLIERLECLSRQLGLKFVVGSSGVNLFISSDMFYLEILVEASGAVKDVKIHHEGKHDQQSCEELVSCISRGDFADFTAQLEGLMAVYQLNAEKKVKCKAFSALQSLEEDLYTLKQMQSYIKDPWAQVHKSPIGFLQKRRGGHAMRLTYFVSPYELLDKEKGLLPLTTELLIKGKPVVASGHKSLVAQTHQPIGHSALVLLEGSTGNKLQLSPIISNGQRQGKGGGGGPVYAPLVPQNSAMLPACFTLRLSEPMPLCAELAKVIQATTEVEIAGDWANPQPMLRLVATQALAKLPKGGADININRGLFVNLPECSQCYLLSESRGVSGCVVRSVGLTHPSHVSALLAALRAQAAFNTLVAGVVRHAPQLELESTVILELSGRSWNSMSVSLEHPYEECLAVVEVSLVEPAAPRAAVHTHAPPSDRVDEHVTAVLRRTMSIPLTIRALLKLWEREAAAKPVNGGYSALEGANFNPALGAPEPGGNPDRTYPNNVAHPHQGPYLSDSNRHMSAMLCSEDTKPSQPEERKSIKRKPEEVWPACPKKGKPGMSEVMDSDTDSDESEVANEDDNSTNSTSSSEVERRGSGASVAETASDAELPDVDRRTDASHGRATNAPSDSDDSDVPDEDITRNSFQKSDHKRQKLKNREVDVRSSKSASSLLVELSEGGPYVPSSVSITPLGPAGVGAGGGALLGLERRPGIEIIPLGGAAPPALPSSITITPITPAQARSMDDRNRPDKKLRLEDRTKDKKKKRRRDESMGPPEKVPPKQDPLTKPVSVSIKPAVSPAASPPSPRLSPLPPPPPPPGYCSPKSLASSPKHSAAGSGKPSMSALKSAVGSPSAKTPAAHYDLSKTAKLKDNYTTSTSGRDKEKKHSGLSFSDRSSPKLKNPIKMKQLEITPVPSDQTIAEPLISPPNIEVNKCSIPSQVRNRKGSLSAVIDKLKSAQHVGPDLDLGGGKPAPSTSINKLSDPKNSQGSGQKPENKNPEYMVKPSSDGMKITINKTRTKESSGSSGSKSNYVSSMSKQSPSGQVTPPGQGSPKTHTGLKPGVMSGPASKKTQATKAGPNPPGTPPKNLSSSDSSASNSPANTPKVPYSKSSASVTGMNLTKTKTSSGSPKSNSTDISKIVRDREREKARAKLLGGNSEKSLFSSKSDRHSPSGARDEIDGYKPSKESNFLVEGLIRPLDTSKFQIPKLKNQSTPDKSSSGYDRSLVNDLARTLDPSKYPFGHFQNPNSRSDDPIQKSAYALTVPKPMLNRDSISPKLLQSRDQIDGIFKGESPQRGKEDSKDSFPGPYPMLPLDFKTRTNTEERKGSDSMKGGGLMGGGGGGGGAGTDVLLDFSTGGRAVSGVVAMRPVFPPSPAPAAHLAPSPLAPSPSITDDDLMDEALVGPGK